MGRDGLAAKIARRKRHGEAPTPAPYRPRAGTVFVSVRDGDKPRILDAVKLLEKLGFKVMATGGTQRYLSRNGVTAEKVNKVLEGRPHSTFHVFSTCRDGEL